MQGEIQPVLRATPPNWEYLQTVTKSWPIEWHQAAISRHELHPRNDRFDEILAERLQRLLDDKIAEIRHRENLQAAHEENSKNRRATWIAGVVCSIAGAIVGVGLTLWLAM